MTWRRPRWFDHRVDSPAASFALAPLTLLSWAYGVLGMVHRAAREGRWLRRERLGCRVVSVGNLSVGGSAKTPLAARVAMAFHEAGMACAILSRGYGRRNPEQTLLVSGGRGAAGVATRSGDEPEWLGAKAKGIPVWVSAHRADAGRRSIIHFGTQVAILDDGFQHTRLERDLDLVAIDGVSGFGNGAVLPRGPLREPPAALRRADALIVVDGPLHPSDEALAVRWAPLAKRFRASRVPTRLFRLGEEAGLSWDVLRKASIGMLCGIAQPESFRRTLRALGAQIGAERLFPDHHAFVAEDLCGLQREASVWVTTEKDALKLERSWGSGVEIWVLAIDIEIEEGPSFDRWLIQALARRP